MPSTSLITFTLPSEWVNALAAGEDDAGFANVAFQQWRREHRGLDYDSHDDEPIETQDHSVPGFSGISLWCREVYFYSPTANPFARTVRRECRISVPQPTKLPLP